VLRTVVPVLALVAVVLTLARASGSQRQVPVLLQALAPLALPVYAVLVLLLAVAAARSEHRVPLVIAALVAAALLAVHATWLAPALRADAAPPGDTVTVMTSNVLAGGADMGAVLAVARTRDVGLLVLEEATPAALCRLEAAGGADTFPFRVGEEGTVVLARTPLTDATTVPGGPKSRAVTWQGRRVFAVHPTFPGEVAAWRSDLAALADRAAGERPALILGDFNASRDHEPFRRILGLGYRDAAEQAGSGWQPTWPTHGLGRLVRVPLPSTVTIDHVLVGEGLVATSTSAVRIPNTDHKALLATITVDRRPGS
jgi:endonuclease/exonuclease/phosphatase (EEP) superfamily protein YafD